MSQKSQNYRAIRVSGAQFFAEFEQFVLSQRHVAASDRGYAIKS